MGVENIAPPHWDSIPDRSASSESLYRLRHCAPLFLPIQRVYSNSLNQFLYLLRFTVSIIHTFWIFYFRKVGSLNFFHWCILFYSVLFGDNIQIRHNLWWRFLKQRCPTRREMTWSTIQINFCSFHLELPNLWIHKVCLGCTSFRKTVHTVSAILQSWTWQSWRAISRRCRLDSTGFLQITVAAGYRKSVTVQFVTVSVAQGHIPRILYSFTSFISKLGIKLWCHI